MILDLSNPIDLNKFITRSKVLQESKKVVELKEIKKRRTIQQNKYLHVLITLCAIEWGYNLNEQKINLKRACDFMTYEKNGNKYLRHTSKLDTLELTQFIEWVKTYAGQQGLILPSPEQYLEHSLSIDKEIDRHKEYL